MEQLKPFLDGCKKHQFWIFCGATLIASVVVYYIASGGYSKKEKEFIANINNAFSNAKKVYAAGVPLDPKNDSSSKTHPNNDTIREMKSVLVVAAKETRKAWKKNYLAQQALQVFEKDLIGAPAVDFRKFLPAESIPFSKDNEAELLPESVRVDYRDKIKKVLPSLAKIIGSYWKPATVQKETMPNEVVVWTDANQKYWNERFTNFVNAWNDEEGRNVPYTLQVLYTSEDIWALRNILENVIAKTVYDKGEVYANDLSVIKKIDHIYVGKDAEFGKDDEEGNASGISSSTGSSSSGGSSSMSSSSGMSAVGSGAIGGKRNNAVNEDDKLDPAFARYVDSDGKDISPKQYRNIYGKAATDQSKVHWKIRKRVKVRIGLQMDSREIPNILANCANAPFPIEVRRLRVNKHKGVADRSGGGSSGSGSGMMSGSSGSGAGSGAQMPSSTGSGSSAGMGAGSGMTGGSGARAASGDSKDDEGYTQPVEIYGYMYIYNDVDNSVFKILKDENNSTP